MRPSVFSGAEFDNPFRGEDGNVNEEYCLELIESFVRGFPGD